MPGEQTNEERAPGMPMWMWMRMRMSRRMDGRNVGGARNGKGWQSSTRGRPSPSRFPGMDGMDAVQATCKVSTCPSCSGLPRWHRALEAPSANQPPPPRCPLHVVPYPWACRVVASFSASRSWRLLMSVVRSYFVRPRLASSPPSVPDRQGLLHAFYATACSMYSNLGKGLAEGCLPTGGEAMLASSSSSTRFVVSAATVQCRKHGTPR